MCHSGNPPSKESFTVGRLSALAHCPSTMLYSTLVKSVIRRIYGPPPQTTGVSDEGGQVWVADGVGGLNLLATSLKYVLPPSGSPHSVRLVPWGHGFGRWPLDLTNVDNHETQAEALAAEVEKFRVQRPGAPEFLVGKSGGTGVVVKALERLPEGSI